MGGIGIGNHGLRRPRGVPRPRRRAVCRRLRRRAKPSATPPRSASTTTTTTTIARPTTTSATCLARTDIDAIHCATPDHWHAIVVIEACRHGKDVYCQKPETRTLREGPLMVAAARRYGRVVSGGSQRVLEDYRDMVNQCWSGELGTIKSINVNVGPLSQALLPARRAGPRRHGLGHVARSRALGPLQPTRGATAISASTADSWRSFTDYSGGGMTDWGAHHFGGAIFAIDCRELEPEEVTYHDEKGQQYLTYRYPNGICCITTIPGQGNLQVVGTPGEKRAAKPVPELQGHGRHLRRLHPLRQDPREAVPRHRVGRRTPSPWPPGHHRLSIEAVAEMGRRQVRVPRRRGSQPPGRSRPPRAVDPVIHEHFNHKKDEQQMQYQTMYTICRGRRRHRPGCGRGRWRKEKPAVDKAAIDKAFEALKTFDWGGTTTRSAKCSPRSKTRCRPRTATRRPARNWKPAWPPCFPAALARGQGLSSAASCASSARPNRCRRWPRCCPTRTFRTWPAMPWSGFPRRKRRKALRDALAKTSGAEKAGVIGSLGVRRDAESIPDLAALVGAADTMVVCAAAHALGTIGTPEAGKALGPLVKQPPEGAEQAATDSCLLCASSFWPTATEKEAMLVYHWISGPNQPKLVRLAATRGLLKCVAGKKIEP